MLLTMGFIKLIYALLAAIALLTGLGIVQLVKAMYRWLFPNGDAWKGYLLGERLPRKGQAAIEWETNRFQQKGDTFLLSIRKTPNALIVDILEFLQKYIYKHINEKIANRIKWWNYGKARVIDRIQFMKGDYSADEYPLKWLVPVSDNHGYVSGWKDKEFTEQQFGYNIIIEITPPVR